MAENKYEEELAKLVSGEVSELVVEKGDFFCSVRRGGSILTETR